MLCRLKMRIKGKSATLAGSHKSTPRPREQPADAPQVDPNVLAKRARRTELEREGRHFQKCQTMLDNRSDIAPKLLDRLIRSRTAAEREILRGLPAGRQARFLA
jgi:hypothetical protein